MSLRYSKLELECIGYCDASWGDSEDRHSTFGVVFSYASIPIAWPSKCQSTVALSTAEAKYIALFTASKEGVWLRKLFADFEVGQTNIKHMDIKYHYVREMVERQAVVTVYSPTDIMLADILTKPLAGQRFEFSRSGLGVVCSLSDRMKCDE